MYKTVTNDFNDINVSFIDKMTYTSKHTFLNPNLLNNYFILF